MMRERYGRNGRSRIAIALMIGALFVSGFGPSLARPQAVDAAPLIHWGYYVTYAKDSFSALQANVGAFTMVSPFYYTIHADGSVKNTEEADTNTLLRKNNVKILPMIKNEATNADFSPQIATPDAREKLATTIATLIVSSAYDGVNLDIEDVVPADRPAFTDFVSRISAKIRPSGKLVTQAIVAKAKDSMTGYGGAFDYPALAPSLDLAVIMAYDYHYAGGDPGPVAPINWVRDVAAYATTTFGTGKVLLGMPLYGYDWNLTQGGSAKAVTYSMALQRAQRPGATRTLDQASMSEVVRYTDDNGNSHEAWFESAATFDAKLRVVREAGLAGFGLWRIGQEDTGLYDILRRGDTPAARSYAMGENNASHYYVPETGHNLANTFKLFYDQNGGLARFGYPLTEEFTERNTADDKMYTVQYFERARFEYHPETASVTLGQIGSEIFPTRSFPLTASTSTALTTAGTPGIAGAAQVSPTIGMNAPRSPGAPVDPPPSAPDKRYFAETHHVIAGGFKQYWEANNGLVYLGYPISEETTENGKTVQYFQRARLEYNPASVTPETRVQSALLGSELLRVRGWVS